MAFTDAQKVEIRRWLGYPDLFRYRDTRLESAIEVVGERPEAQALAEDLLDKLNDPTNGVVIHIVNGASSAGLKRADDVEFYPASSGGAVVAGMSGQAAGAIAVGRLWIGQLSTLFGVPIYSDPFTGRGYAGDSFMGVRHQYGGMIRMG